MLHSKKCLLETSSEINLDTFFNFISSVSTFGPEIDLGKRNKLKEWQQKWQSDQQSIWDRQKLELEQHRQKALQQLQVVMPELTKQTESEEIEDYEILNQFVHQPTQQPAVKTSTAGWNIGSLNTQYEISFDSNTEEGVSEKPK